MNFDIIKNTLLTVTKNVYHYEALKKHDKYIVWAEDSEAGALSVDNKKSMQIIQGTIDYFTKQDGDKNIDLIQKALNNSEISFYLNSIQYEEETGYIHYEWVWEVLNG